jgi:hypothetical protein
MPKIAVGHLYRRLGHKGGIAQLRQDTLPVTGFSPVQQANRIAHPVVMTEFLALCFLTLNLHKALHKSSKTIRTILCCRKTLLRRHRKTEPDCFSQPSLQGNA